MRPCDLPWVHRSEIEIRLPIGVVREQINDWDVSLAPQLLMAEAAEPGLVTAQ